MTAKKLVLGNEPTPKESDVSFDISELERLYIVYLKRRISKDALIQSLEIHPGTIKVTFLVKTPDGLTTFRVNDRHLASFTTLEEVDVFTDRYEITYRAQRSNIELCMKTDWMREYLRQYNIIIAKAETESGGIM